MTITERAAYIKGLAEGLGIDDSTKEGKIINALIGAIDDMSLTISDLESQIDELSEQVETIDEDLGSLEEDFYDLDDECGCGCEDDEDDDYLESIHNMIRTEMVEEGQTTCPNCGELLEFDLEEDCGDDHCDCDK